MEVNVALEHFPLNTNSTEKLPDILRN